ncbi:MAG TPA: 1-acyl-sn-glycerol-3-phosphate acyltransferase [Crocinitomix sp.]|nr:1-acyl-sn-glycerol-3-phosphate acyltransferase [Crocinitomix sp.]
MIKITSILKIIIMALWTIISVIIAFTLIIINFRTSPAIWFAHKIWAPFLMFILGAKLSIEGLENINPKEKYIILANHTSFLDIPMLTAGLPILFYYVAKKEMQKIPFLGWIMTASGIIFIDRENKNKAIRSMRKAGNKIKGGKNVMIFPEGTFYANKEKLIPFKKGAFHLAIHAQVPILPVAIVGATNIWPADSHLQLKRGNCKLIVGKPINTKGYTLNEVNDLLDITYKEMYKLIP